ncbi:MAG: hypothetical protein ACI4JI_01070, partial [Ruminiclostridium sp.]
WTPPKRVRTTRPKCPQRIAAPQSVHKGLGDKKIALHSSHFIDLFYKLKRDYFDNPRETFSQKSFPLTLPEMLFHLRKYAGNIFVEALSLYRKKSVPPIRHHKKSLKLIRPDMLILRYYRRNSK